MGLEIFEEDISMEFFNSKLTSEENKDKMVVVDFFATWCPPCTAMSPILEKLVADHPDKVAVIKLDVDKCTIVSGELGIEAMPTFFFYKNGTKVDELVGASEAELLSKAGI